MGNGHLLNSKRSTPSKQSFQIWYPTHSQYKLRAAPSWWVLDAQAASLPTAGQLCSARSQSSQAVFKLLHGAPTSSRHGVPPVGAARVTLH